jgi:hypothetical protein
VLGVKLVAACASAGAPPGGPERKTPPEITEITVDSGQTNVNIKSVEFKFDEVVSDRPSGTATALDQIFLISPRNGAAVVRWHRTRVDIRPRNGFRPNTVYRITMLPGLVDLRGNVRKDTRTVLFSTGPGFPPFQIRGRVFDWATQRPAVGAYIEAISHPDTSVVYLAATDTSGQYDVGPLPAGTYTVRALIDANANRTIDRGEKWDSVTTVIAATSPGDVELDAIERDSLPATMTDVASPDSLTLRITFDKPLDPELALQPALVRIQRADSTEMPVTSVQWQLAFDQSRALRDSVRRADSLRALAPRGAPPAAVTLPAPVSAPTGVRAAPPPPKPKALPPERAIVVTFGTATPLVPGSSYRITVRGMRNLVGNSRDATRIFTVPKPTPKPPPKPAATDNTKRPPAPPAKPPR